MSPATRLGLVLVAAGVPLGVLGDALLRKTPLGLNVLLWTAAFLVALTAVVRVAGRTRAALFWPFVPLVLFSALVVWRDSPWLVALDLFALLSALSLVVVPAARFRARDAGITEYATGAIAALAGAGGGAAVTLFEEISWRELPRSRASRHAAAVARGFALALPLLALFGGLFIAADAVFERLVVDLVPGDPAAPVVHVLIAAAWGWIAIGLLRQFVRPEADEPFGAVESRRRLGAVETGVLLGLLNLLFLTFVLVQLRYLFGGESRVEAETGLTYAEYARQGFFELVAVAALVLPLVLLVDWALRRDRRSERVFRALAGLLLVLLFVVMASALERMRLYQREYGLTELRVYATAFMLWLGAVFLWATVTVLRGRRHRFALGALVAGFAAIAAVNALNPDALIARTNIDRVASGRPVDHPYLMRLSDDAVPTLLAELRSLPPAARSALAADLLARGGGGDWRTWNWSRRRADDLLEERRAELEAYAARAQG